jgi:hypothetical protein
MTVGGGPGKVAVRDCRTRGAFRQRRRPPPTHNGGESERESVSQGDRRMHQVAAQPLDAESVGCLLYGLVGLGVMILGLLLGVTPVLAARHAGSSTSRPPAG